MDWPVADDPFEARILRLVLARVAIGRFERGTDLISWGTVILRMDRGDTGNPVRRPRPRRTGVYLPIDRLSAGIILLVLVAALLPSSSGSAPNSIPVIYTFTSPFSGTAYGCFAYGNCSSPSLGSACGQAHGTWQTTPRFSLGSGMGRLSGNASVSACPAGWVNTSRASLAGNMGLVGENFSVNVSGLHEIVVRWSLSFSGNVSAFAGTNHSGLFGAGASVLVGVGARVNCFGNGGGSIGYWDHTYASNGARVTFKVVRQIVTLYNQVWLHAGRVCYFETSSGMILSLAVQGQAAWATGSVDMASSGMHVRLVSLKVK